MGINQFYCEYKMTIPDYKNVKKEYYIYKGKVYDNYLKILNEGNNVATPQLPFTDTSSTIVVYISLPYGLGIVDKEFTAEEVNKAFWKEVWSNAKTLGKMIDGKEPSKVTMIAYNREKTIINVVDRSRKSFNKGKLMHLFDFNFLVSFDFLSVINNNVSWSSISINSIYDYKKAKIDMYGTAR